VAASEASVAVASEAAAREEAGKESPRTQERVLRAEVRMKNNEQRSQNFGTSYFFIIEKNHDRRCRFSIFPPPSTYRRVNRIRMKAFFR